MSVPQTLRLWIWDRAANRCEYCRMLQAHDPATFEVDHIIPEKMNGPTKADNLALACFSVIITKVPTLLGLIQIPILRPIFSTLARSPGPIIFNG